MNYSETYFELDSEEATHSHPLSPYLLCVHQRARANMCQCTLFDVGGVEIHSIECIEYCTKDQSNVEDIEDRSNTHKGCNAMYVEDVEDIKTSHNRCILKYVEDVEDRSNTHQGCNAMYVEDVEDIKTSHNRCILKHVEDVEDRSNTHKGCNAMYVEDVEDGKRTYTHILAHNFLNT